MNVTYNPGKWVCASGNTYVVFLKPKLDYISMILQLKKKSALDSTHYPNTGKPPKRLLRGYSVGYLRMGY